MKLKRVISMLLAAALVTGLSVGGASAANAPEDPAVVQEQQAAAQSEAAGEEAVPAETETQEQEQEQPQSSGKDVLLWMLREKLTTGGVEQSQIDAALAKAETLSEDELRELVEGEGLPVPELLTRLGVNPPAEESVVEKLPAMDNFDDPDNANEGSGQTDGAAQTGSQTGGTTQGSGQTDGAAQTGSQTGGTTQGSGQMDGAAQTGSQTGGTTQGSGQTDGTAQTGSQTGGAAQGSGQTDGAAQTGSQTGNTTQNDNQTDGTVQGNPLPDGTTQGLPPAMDSFPGADEAGTDELTQDAPVEELSPAAVVAGMFTPAEIEGIRRCFGGNVSDAEILETAAILYQEGLSKEEILDFFLGQHIQTYATDPAKPEDLTAGDIIKVEIVNKDSLGSIQINPYNMAVDGSTDSLITKPIVLKSTTDAQVEVTATASVRTKGGVTLVGQSARGGATNERNVFLFMELQNRCDPSGAASWTDPALYTDLLNPDAGNQRTRIPEPGQTQSKPITFTMDKGTNSDGTPNPTYAALKIGGDCSVPVSLTTWKSASEGYFDGTQWVPTEEDGVEVTVIFTFTAAANDEASKYDVIFKFQDFWDGGANYVTEVGTITANGSDITGGTKWLTGEPLNFHCQTIQPAEEGDDPYRISSVFLYKDKDKHSGVDGDTIPEEVWNGQADEILYKGAGLGTLTDSGDFTIPEWMIEPGKTAVVVIQLG